MIKVENGEIELEGSGETLAWEIGMVGSEALEELWNSMDGMPLEKKAYTIHLFMKTMTAGMLTGDMDVDSAVIASMQTIADGIIHGLRKGKKECTSKMS